MAASRELFVACKTGNVEKLKHLIEVKEVELNVRDKWDSTPLYYACLCGHTNVVRYLLRSGARCEANTFDGERCLYGALTVDIRKILREHKCVTSKIMVRSTYDEFLRRLFEVGDHFDVIFCVHREMVKAHRCVLSARCDYFADMFNGKWRTRKIVSLRHPRVKSSAFRTLLRYLYTGRLDAHLNEVDDVLILAKQCKLMELYGQIEKAVKKVEQFECSKPGTNVTTITIESYTHAVDFGVLVGQALPGKLRTWIGGDELPSLPDLSRPMFSDIAFQVEGELFRCHKVFFAARSDFLKAIISDHFLEHKDTDDLPVHTLHDLSSSAFVGLLAYVYQDSAELTEDNVYELLALSDLYMMPGLKKQAANYVGRRLDVDNVTDILRTARLFGLTRLELQCSEFMAARLEDIVTRAEFEALVQEDAREVKERQEADTIDVIDDIRYHISSNVQTFSAMEEAEEKLKLIDELLERLNLEA